MLKLGHKKTIEKRDDMMKCWLELAGKDWKWLFVQFWSVVLNMTRFNDGD